MSASAQDFAPTPALPRCRLTVHMVQEDRLNLARTAWDSLFQKPAVWDFHSCSEY